MDPMHRARDLLSGNGDMRSQQDRKMGFCEFKKIRRRYHVAAGFTWLATTFFLQKQVIASLCFAAAPFRKRSRLLRLLGCKRPPVASAALPIACGVPAPARVRMWILLWRIIMNSSEGRS